MVLVIHVPAHGHSVTTQVDCTAFSPGSRTGRVAEISRIPGWSQSPSGRKITYAPFSTVIALGRGAKSTTISVYLNPETMIFLSLIGMPPKRDEKPSRPSRAVP